MVCGLIKCLAFRYSRLPCVGVCLLVRLLPEGVRVTMLCALGEVSLLRVLGCVHTCMCFLAWGLHYSQLNCVVVFDCSACLQISAEEQKKMDEKVMIDGVKRVVSKLLARRKLKRSYEYEVQWEGQPSSSDYTAWLSRDRSVLSPSLIHSSSLCVSIIAGVWLKLFLSRQPLAISAVA